MTDKKALLYAMGVTIGSIVLETIVHEMPPPEQLVGGSIAMMGISFVVFRLWK